MCSIRTIIDYVPTNTDITHLYINKKKKSENVLLKPVQPFYILEKKKPSYSKYMFWWFFNVERHLPLKKNICFIEIRVTENSKYNYFISNGIYVFFLCVLRCYYFSNSMLVCGPELQNRIMSLRLVQLSLILNLRNYTARHFLMFPNVNLWWLFDRKL